MNKKKSGLILFLIAVVMNVGGRLIIGSTGGGQGVGSAGILALLMFSSVVVGLFGLFRLISGLRTKE